jgi:microcystin-dependent protein
MPEILGRISLLPYDFTPAGWSRSDGQKLIIYENEALFDLLSTTFGGDGEQTFALPNLEAAAPRNCHYYISLTGYREDTDWPPVGQTFISATKISSQNFAECAGQSLPVNKYLVLKTYMGTRFGGDGQQSFNLPDLRSKAPANCRYMMGVQGKDPFSAGQDLFVGEIMLFPFDTEFQGLRLCNGDKLPIEQNKALFSLLRDRFGGDGQKTFALPDLRTAAPPQFSYYINMRGVFPMRQ